MPVWWPQVEDGVAKALHGRSLVYAPCDLYDGCLNREMFLWLALEGERVRGAVVARINGHKYATIAYVIVLAGEGMKEWLHFEPAIAAWARENDADAIEFTGREGWKRAAPPMGYQPVYTTFRKML